MPAVFADSGYWIATLDERDPLHARATDVIKELGRVRIITTQMVMTEVLNFASRAGIQSRLSAVELIRDLDSAPNVEIVPQTPAQFREAVDLFGARQD